MATAHSKHPLLVFIVGTISTVFLLVTLNGLMSGPVSVLRHASQDGRADALSAVVAAASWGAVLAAASVMLGTLFSLGEGRMGAVGKGVNAGASVAVFVAALFLALPAGIS